jgi:hypothetical protein
MTCSRGGKKMWCIAELDEEYIACMEDVLAVYEQPFSEEEPVVCVDEKPVVLHADVRPPRPLRPGRVARRDSEYKREGTANVFCGVEPKAGRHYPGYCEPLLTAIRRLPGGDRFSLSPGKDHPPGPG